MNKVTTVEKAMEGIKDSTTIMIGGFLGVGTPEEFINALVKKNVRNLTIIANDTAFPDKGIGKLVVNKQVKKIIVSHIGTNPETGRQMNSKEMEVELVPQGTLAERIRAGGAGLGGVLTPTGIGTVVAKGKQTLVIDEREYLLEKPLKADFALLKAYRADEKGNLVFRRSARNFNPLLATAADTVIAQVEQLVPTGNIDPDAVVVPGIFVDYIVQG
ncbi:MAG: 3-oxoacid CoA-transferase, subunit [Firmicutes bacterium]|nr:3-oxoacid CoA-transferase, subunit [Bacillota bacterium]